MDIGLPLPAARWPRRARQAGRAAPRQADHATTRVMALCLVGVIAHPLCYLVWHRLWPENYESLTLRAVAVALCLVSLGARRFTRRELRLYQVVLFSYTLSFSSPSCA